MTRFNKLYAMLLLGVLPFVLNAQNAQTTVWKGDASADWFDGNNWTNGVPDAGRNAQIPANLPGNRPFPEIHQPLVANFDIKNFGQILIDAPVTNLGIFENKNGAQVKNRNSFENKNRFVNNAIFENGCLTCNNAQTELVNGEGGSFYNHSTIVPHARIILNPCSVTYFDSPTKANLAGDIRLLGVAYLLQGDVQFSEQTGTVLFSLDEQAAPSVEARTDVEIQLDANGQATLAPEVLDNGSTADYCRVASFSVNKALFTCADVGPQIVTFTVTDGYGHSQSYDVPVLVKPSAACFCSTLSNGGLIGGTQSFCPGDNPAPLFDSIAPSGAPVGYNIEYLWEMATSDPENGGAGNEIQGAETASYLITALSQSAWFRRSARLQGCQDYTAFSNWQYVERLNPTPQANCQNLTIVLPNSGTATITADQVDNGSLAGCAGIESYSLSQSSFTVVGTYQVTLLVASPRSDVGACTATVTVRTPPQVGSTINQTCPTDVQVTAQTYTATGAIANFSAPTASTNCTSGGVSIVQTSGLPSGSFFPIGTTPIVYTITDPCGTARTCSFNVVVIKPAAPTYCGRSRNSCISVDLECVTVKQTGETCYQYKVKNTSPRPIKSCSFELNNRNTRASNQSRNCRGASGRRYKCDNGTRQPFHCIKFNCEDEGIKNGEEETFTYTLPAGCAVPPQIQVSVEERYCQRPYTLTLRTYPTVYGGGNNLAAPAYALKSDVARKGFNAQVNWQAKIGKSVEEYKIERSTDGEKWEIVHTEPGGGGEGEITYHRWEDESPLPGKSYYRVNARLNIGLDWWTDGKMVEMPEFGSFTMFPNPASEQTWLDLKPYAGKKVLVSVSDNMGKVVRTLEIPEAAQEPYKLSVNGLDNGYYNVHISCEGLKMERKLIVNDLK